MGKGVFTSDDTAVDHAKGVFRLIPQDELTALLAHPVTVAIYLREYCISFFQETSLTECLHMIHDLSSVHPDLARDTDWLASRLSGGNAPPLGVEKDLMSTYNVLLVATHEATPYRRLIKEYLVHKVEALPGCIGSSKGKRTKLPIWSRRLIIAPSSCSNKWIMGFSANSWLIGRNCSTS